MKLFEAIRKFLELLSPSRTTATTIENGEPTELHLSKAFIHKVSMMVIIYIFGLMTGLMPILNYFNVSRPALVAELTTVRDDNQKGLITLKKQLYDNKLAIVDVELSLRNKERTENQLSVDSVNSMSIDKDTKKALISAYQKERVMLDEIIAKLTVERNDIKEKIISLAVKE